MKGKGRSERCTYGKSLLRGMESKRLRTTRFSNTETSGNQCGSRRHFAGPWMDPINADLKHLICPVVTPLMMRTLSASPALLFFRRRSSYSLFPLRLCCHDRATPLHHCFAPFVGFQCHGPPPFPFPIPNVPGRLPRNLTILSPFPPPTPAQLFQSSRNDMLGNLRLSVQVSVPVRHSFLVQTISMPSQPFC